MEKEIVKEYSNGEITVIWKPKMCIHAAECVKALPAVYDPKAKPWIKVENATTEELKAQIGKCPSGALSYKAENGVPENKNGEVVRVEMMENGPLLVYGNLEIKDPKGNIENKSKTTAFCRCGASNNKPYCDGSHIKVGFKDE